MAVSIHLAKKKAGFLSEPGLSKKQESWLEAGGCAWRTKLQRQSGALGRRVGEEAGKQPVHESLIPAENDTLITRKNQGKAILR